MRLLVQYRPEEYNRYAARLHEIQQSMTGTLVRTSPKRSLYVRALFDYNPSQDDGLPSRGLGFAYGDILHVTNASDEEWWQARKVLPNGEEAGLGIVPSKVRWERKMGKKSRKEIQEENLEFCHEKLIYFLDKIGILTESAKGGDDVYFWTIVWWVLGPLLYASTMLQTITDIPLFQGFSECRR